jgi:hypothetical protein
MADNANGGANPLGLDHMAYAVAAAIGLGFIVEGVLAFYGRPIPGAVDGGIYALAGAIGTLIAVKRGGNGNGGNSSADGRALANGSATAASSSARSGSLT